MEVDNAASTTGGEELLSRNTCQNLFDQNFHKEIPKSDTQKQCPYTYNSISHANNTLGMIQSLQKNNILCDVKLETDDGTVIHGHKIVLASACDYFRSMFTGFEECKKDHIILRELDSSSLQLIVNFIYTGQITIDLDNVEDLFATANFLQIYNVENACGDFLQNHLRLTNCLKIYELADLYCSSSLLVFSESYIRHHFLELLHGVEFLFLSFDQIVKFISNDELTVSSESEVLDSIIRWVNYDSSCRLDVFPQLLKHIRLPLISKEYLLEKIKMESLLKKNHKCMDYILEEIKFRESKSDEVFHDMPIRIRAKPRYPVNYPKAILVVGGRGLASIGNVEWFNPENLKWNSRPEMNYTFNHCRTSLAVLKDQDTNILFGFFSTIELNISVSMLNLSSQSPSWEPSTPMIVNRGFPGIAVLENYIYAVGGLNKIYTLNTAEVFDYKTRKWQKISNMIHRRCHVGMGVLNNLIYVIGGYDTSSGQYLKSVECYNPITDTWTEVAELNINRGDLGVGVLNGVIYAVGGSDTSDVYNIVEIFNPSEGVWTAVPNMRFHRRNPGVVTLNGLLYVVGGDNGFHNLGSIEFYNPNTMIWHFIETPMNSPLCCTGVAVIDKLPQFNVTL